MLDNLEAREAFRDLLVTLVVATTGSTSLSATTVGYVRAAGSFLTDGFAPGMEVTPSGFSVAANNNVAIIQSVTATLMTITGGRAVEVAAAGKTLTVGLPVDRRWQDTQTPATASVATKPYIQEEWVRGANGSLGQPPVISLLGNTGQYVVSWFGLGNKGANAMSRQIDAVLELFPPGYSVFVGSDMLRIEGNPAPYATTPTPLANGYSVSQITIPWRAVSANMNITAA